MAMRTEECRVWQDALSAMPVVASTHVCEYCFSGTVWCAVGYTTEGERCVHWMYETVDVLDCMVRLGRLSDESR